VKVTSQVLSAGAAEAGFQKCLAAIAERRLVLRFWRKDLTLWPRLESRKDSAQLALDWLDLAAGLPDAVSRISALAEKLGGIGIQDVVFLATSISSKAAELVLSLGLPTRGVRFHVLNRTESPPLRALEKQLDLGRTLFLVASKTGKNLEMHALLLYFLSRVKSAGVVSPGANFIAITEEGSYLYSLATENHFQSVLREPHGFRGRFSGVQHYGLLLCGLCGLPLAKILAQLNATRSDCGRTEGIPENPAAKLAAFLAAIAQRGDYRLVFRSSEKLVPLAKRLAHLVGSSTCKNDTGILPFLEVQVSSREPLKSKCSICDISMHGEDPPKPLDPSIPRVALEIDDLESIPARVFEWEIATALACSLLNVDPFEDPDDADGRDDAMQYIDQFSVNRHFSFSRPRITERGISLFVEGELRHDISSLGLEHALASVFALCGPDGYCLLMNYLWKVPAVRLSLTTCADRLGANLGVPVAVVPGPRYLHVLGQSYKAGPRGGIALMLTCDSSEKIEIPGAGYTFGDLEMALALGDFDAMNRRGRSIVRLHLTGTPDTAMAQLQELTDKALKLHTRSR